MISWWVQWKIFSVIELEWSSQKSVSILGHIIEEETETNSGEAIHQGQN